MASQPRPISGRVVVITGGARGIGRATAQELLREGARVAIGDIDVETARATAAELGGGCEAFELDVTSRESFASFLDSAEQAHGPVDVVINNAGIMLVGPFDAESDSACQRMLDINVSGVILGTRLALERMLPRRSGHIVNIASSAGVSPIAGAATYAATKHAVVGLTSSLYVEHRDSGLDFSIVMPGIVNTELAGGLRKTRAVAVVEPEDVAKSIADELRNPRLLVFVPRSVGAINKLVGMLPRRAQEWIGRTLQVDRVMTEADMAARAGYEQRASSGDRAEQRDADREPVETG